MNIFKILSRGHGRINETNVTSFLGFLIDPYAEHGMGKLFLSEFLKKTNTEGKLKGLYSNGELSKELLNKYNIHVELESQLDKKIKDKEDKKSQSRIDIYVEFNAIPPNDKSYVMGIEVKINETAINDDQLSKYANNLKDININNTFTECHLVYLTVDKTSNASTTATESTKSINDVTTKHIDWDDITEILEKIINADNQAKIDPLHYNTKLTIQAFNQFISSNFSDDKDGKSMKYRVIINNDEIYENKAGQMVRQICKYLIENEIIDILKINHLTNKIKVKTKKEIPTKQKLIINQTDFEKYKSEVEGKLTDGKISNYKFSSGFCNDYIGSITEDKYGNVFQGSDKRKENKEK